MESALHPLQSQVRTSSGEVKSELRHRADTFAANGLLVPFSINGKQHNIVAVNGRAIIQAKINGTVVPMYLHTGMSRQAKAPGFIPYAGMHVSAQGQNGTFNTWQMKGGGKWEDEGRKHIDTGEPIFALNPGYVTYGDNLTPNSKSESEGWGDPDLNAARKQITGLFFHNTQIPTGRAMERFISPQSFPDILHIDSDKPEHYAMARQIAAQQAFNMPKAFSTRGDFWGQDEPQHALALRARSHAIVRSIADNIAHPTNGRSAQTTMFQRIRQLLDTTFRRSMVMKPNPFPLQLSLLAKASSEPSGSQSEEWIAPGGEQLRSEKARRFFLDVASGDADLASVLQKKAIKEHNDLYLADKQPRGMSGNIRAAEGRGSSLPPNPYPELTGDEKAAMDPAAAASQFNDKRDWPPLEGETQDQANAEADASNKQLLDESLVIHTDPFTISADPNNARQWKYHGLQNSFANHDAFNNIPLHELYNQLSKAYKTPAWQRAEGQNPEGGLNAKGRASAKAEGHNLKAPVKSGDNPRRASFLARMGNSPGPEYDEHGKPTRLLLSLQAWGASSKADARRKAKAISARLKISKSQSDGPPGLDLGKKKKKLLRP